MWLINCLSLTAKHRTGTLAVLAGAIFGLTSCVIDTPGPSGQTDVQPLPEPKTSQLEARLQGLRDLHDQCAKAFIDQPGFGKGRIRSNHLPIKYPDTITLPPGTLSGIPSIEDGLQLHEPADEVWNVESPDLIGLAFRAEPLVFKYGWQMEVYLARPANISRQLDVFEKVSLAALKKGGLIEIANGTDEIRMVGAIRTQAKCVQCHKDHGDVLGAFTYVLRRAQP